jgi:hypothetical protein
MGRPQPRVSTFTSPDQCRLVPKNPGAKRAGAALGDTSHRATLLIIGGERVEATNGNTFVTGKGGGNGGWIGVG